MLQYTPTILNLKQQQKPDAPHKPCSIWKSICVEVSLANQEKSIVIDVKAHIFCYMWFEQTVLDIQLDWKHTPESTDQSSFTQGRELSRSLCLNKTAFVNWMMRQQQHHADDCVFMKDVKRGEQGTHMCEMNGIQVTHYYMAKLRLLKSAMCVASHTAKQNLERCMLFKL